MKQPQPQKLERWIKKELPRVVDNLILQNGSEYNLFGRYIIRQLKNKTQVFENETEVGNFSNLQIAAGWCVAKKYNQQELAASLYDIDHRIDQLDQDISMRLALLAKSKTLGFYDRVVDKINEKINRREQMKNQLADCINWAKYLQQRGFNNETPRSGRGPSNQTR